LAINTHDNYWRGAVLTFGQTPAEGLYTEGCMVLAEGQMVDGRFHVRALGFPPPENPAQSRYVSAEFLVVCIRRIAHCADAGAYGWAFP